MGGSITKSGAFQAEETSTYCNDPQMALFSGRRQRIRITKRAFCLVAAGLVLTGACLQPGNLVLGDPPMQGTGNLRAFRLPEFSWFGNLPTGILQHRFSR